MASAQARIILLGRIAIERADTPEPAASLSGRRAEVVFAYLAVERRRSVSRDELANVLWPEMLPDTWNAALRGVLSDVRRFLERAELDPTQTLLTEQGRLRLQLPVGVRIDIDEAREHVAEARERLTQGDAQGAAELALRAADAAGLPFLSFHDDDWASGVRTELDRLHISSLELAGAAFAKSGDLLAALGAADRLVRADPFLESAHRLRIAMLGQTGDRAGALKAYERCKSLLATELGIEPSPETANMLRNALLWGAPVAKPTAARPTREPEADAPPVAPALRPTFADYSVMVVEDHDFQRRTTLMLLRGLGVTGLQAASDGAAALLLLDDAPAPDVIVCDIDMPGMDGVEFIRNVAERRLASAVIIASGLDGRVLETVRAASEGYGLQVLGAVGKPLNASALEMLLGRYRPQRTATAVSDPSAEIAALARALDDRTLHVAFEPIVDLAVGRVAGFRATVESAHADQLLEAADAAGMGRRLVEYVLERARDAAAEVDLEAYVDLSPSLLTDVALADALAAISRERVILVADAAALAVENSPRMLDVLARLRVKGYGICIDGFDAESLERLPLTHVKLPNEFVALAAAAGDAAPLQPAVDAARTLGVPLIGRATTAAEFDLLLQVGCSFALGPFLSAAVPASRLAEVARDWTAPTAMADQAP